MDNNSTPPQQTQVFPAASSIPQVPTETNKEMNVSSLYDQGFNKKTMFFTYFFVRVWPPLKRHTEEVAFFVFKVFRAFVKFALTQIGIRSGG